MNTAIAERPAERLTVTSDQLALITRTVAKDATPDELQLYLYDCKRQGVHPLDKLIHFTKRSGKYTPITSIDFMRIRAAETGELAGSDDALFMGGGGTTPPAAATVTVWRLVQGQRCAFTATARWSEYKPDQDFMWRKMPCTMLGKCAEALALRKGFPRQLAGLYAKEELDQAEAPPSSDAPVLEVAPEPSAPRAVPTNMPAEARIVTKVGQGISGSRGEIWFHLPVDGKEHLLTWDKDAHELALEVQLSGEPVFVTTKTSATGTLRVEKLTRVDVPF